MEFAIIFAWLFCMSFWYDMTKRISTAKLTPVLHYVFCINTFHVYQSNLLAFSIQTSYGIECQRCVMLSLAEIFINSLGFLWWKFIIFICSCKLHGHPYVSFHHINSKQKDLRRKFLPPVASIFYMLTNLQCSKGFFTSLVLQEYKLSGFVKGINFYLPLKTGHLMSIPHSISVIKLQTFKSVCAKAFRLSMKRRGV